MAEIRRLCAGEIASYSRLKSIVFNIRRDFLKEEKEAQATQPASQTLDHPPEWSWGAFEGGKLVSAMAEIEYLMRFDRHSVPMSGIASVGTLPEDRKGGLIRSVFQRLFTEAYERGVVFSCLYPFSHVFYRKFGYEIASIRNMITVSTRSFSHLKLRGKFTQIFPGDDCSALNEIHREYIADLNHGILRDSWPNNRLWRIFTKDDPYATGIFVYLWQNEEGKNSGYIKYQDVINGEDHILNVLELAFIDHDALNGVLSLIGGLEAQIAKFQWQMPSFIDPADFIKTDRDQKQEIISRNMTRVINVKAALEKMRCPAGEGEYIIEVNDDMMAANSGRYLVEYGSGESRVSVTQKDAHLSCDMLTLSQLVTGYRTLENALRTRQSGLELYGNRETLEKVFTQRPQHLTESF